nr:gamma-glutamyltransferase [Bacillota bacterium]
VDKYGNAVALTQTLSSFFGAGVAVPDTGIILNNQMQNFNAPGHPNELVPGKRPRTIIAPTIVLKDGKPFLVVGSPGAARIIYAMVHILTNVIDFGMGIQEAIDAPRTYSYATSNRTEIEARIPESVREELRAMGYSRIDVRGDYDLYFGGAQAILIDPETGELRGAADPRRAGGVVAY